jgi:hypothetical protein
MAENLKSSGENGPNSEQRVHHDFALLQFQKSIRQIRERLSNGHVRLRLALISCLLFICFESFHGDLDSAMAQVASGLNLLRDWYAQKEKRLLDQARTPNPNDEAIEAEFLQMFARLEYQARSHACLDVKGRSSRISRVGRNGFTHYSSYIQHFCGSQVFLGCIAFTGPANEPEYRQPLSILTAT